MWGKTIAFGGGHLAGAVDKVSPLLCHAEFLSLRPDVVPPFIRSAKESSIPEGRKRRRVSRRDVRQVGAGLL